MAPVVTRVDTDSAQTHAWQKESSVRHVQNPYPVHPGSSNQTAPLEQWQGQDLEAPSPYTHRNGSGTPDSQSEQRREYRNSGWGRAQNVGSVPVDGSG